MKLLLCIMILMSTAAYGAWHSTYYNSLHSDRMVLARWNESPEPRMGVASGFFADRSRMTQQTNSQIKGDPASHEQAPENSAVLQAAICATLDRKPEENEPIE